jgi:hypothetical protein
MCIPTAIQGQFAKAAPEEPALLDKLREAQETRKAAHQELDRLSEARSRHWKRIANARVAVEEDREAVNRVRQLLRDDSIAVALGVAARNHPQVCSHSSRFSARIG